jgi:hypothetical protein
MTRANNGLVLLAVVAAAVGCGGVDDPTLAPPAAMTEPAPRAPGMQVVLGNGPQDRLQIELIFRSGQKPSRVQALGIQSGQSRVVLDGDAATLAEATLALSDLDIDEALLPPMGLHLRDIRASMAAPARGQRRAGTDVFDFLVDIDVDWSLVAPDGSKAPLAPARFAGLPITFTLPRGATGAAAIDADVQRVIWSWGGLVDFANLTLHASGDAQ